MRLIAGLVALLSVLCLATGASAHASLVSVEPGNGSILAEAPKRVELRFNERVTPGAIKLIDATGSVREDAAVDAAGEAVTVTLPDHLPEGTQIVSYRVISQDGHPVGGSVMFSIGAPSATTIPPAADTVVDGLIWISRIGLYLGLFVGVGGVFFVCWIAPRSAATGVILAALALGVLSAAALLGLQGLDVLGLPLRSIARLSVWQTALDTSVGPALLVAMAAMSASLLAMRIARPALSRALAALGLAGVGISLAATGHAATAPPEALTRPAIFLHGVGVAFWLGALAPLVVLVWKPQGEPEGSPVATLQRFSRVAVPVVGLLVLTGLVLATVQLESFGALIETRYGLILLTKLLFVAALVGLAALNRLRLVPALARQPRATRPLARSIQLECAAAAAILAVVALWRFTPPPRTLVPDTPLAVHIHAEKAMFQVLISPGRVGDDGFVLQLMNRDGSPLHAKEAALTLSLPQRGIEPMERSAALGPDGYWHIAEATLPLPGRWHMRIDALVSDFEEITLEDDFDVPAQ